MNDTPAPISGASRRLLVVTCIAFVVAGMSQAALGPTIHDLARQVGATSVATGSVFTAIFVTSFAAQSVTALVLRRFGPWTMLVTGMCVYLLGGVGLMISPDLNLLLSAAALAGIGFGTIVLTGNVLAAEASECAGHLNLVNAMFGVGAIISPALVSASMVGLGSGVHALWVAPVGMSIGLLILLTRPTPRLAVPVEDPSLDLRAELRNVFSSALLWALAGFLLMEVVIEVGLAAWLPTLLTLGVDVAPASGALLMSWFWGLLTAARLLAAWTSRRTTPMGMLRLCTGAAAGGTLVLLIGLWLGSLPLALFGTTMIAPAIGPILPNVLAMVRANFQANSGVATGLVFGAANISGAVCPMVLGAAIYGWSPTGAGMILLGAAATMGVLLALVRDRSR